jgi:uncharacterized membrane protein
LSRGAGRAREKPAVSYRTLDAPQIVETLRILQQRIAQRFPQSSLSKVARELVDIGDSTQRRAQEIAAPNVALRITVYVAIAAGVVGLGTVALVMSQLVQLQVGNEVFGLFQGIEAAMNITVLTGAALFFAVSIEDRIKRRRSLSELHVFRTIAHVIDMHQLTKDPSALLEHGPSTGSSPRRTMSRFELVRYLDYCSEMLSLTSKLAALYAQNLPDPVVIDAVNDIEELTSNLSRKIWQKITILESSTASVPMPHAVTPGTRDAADKS